MAISLRASIPDFLAERNRYRPKLTGVTVAALAFLVALAFSAPLVHQSGLSGDEHYYARIADHPAGPHNFPYAFRIGVPYLVHLLPFAHSFSWPLLALLALGGAAGALFALLREFEVGPHLAVWLAIAFALSPPALVVLLRNGISVDAAVILVITLGTLFIVRRQRLALSLTLLAGATVHESCLFLIALAYAVWADRLLDVEAVGEVAVVAAIPVIFYVYLRSTIVAVGEIYQPGYNGSLLGGRVDVVRAALASGGWGTEIRRMALVYGPLWLAAPFAVPSLRFARRSLVVVALCVGSMTFALDWGRIVFFAAPIVYVSAAWVLRDRRRLAIAAIIGLLGLDLAYAGYMQLHGVRHGLDSSAPPARGPVR